MAAEKSALPSQEINCIFKYIQIETSKTIILNSNGISQYNSFSLYFYFGEHGDQHF